MVGQDLESMATLRLEQAYVIHSLVSNYSLHGEQAYLVKYLLEEQVYLMYLLGFLNGYGPNLGSTEAYQQVHWRTQKSENFSWLVTSAGHSWEVDVEIVSLNVLHS